MAKRHNRLGIFIVLEGADGSGKGTQFRLLTERLRAAGHDIAVFDFPRYEEESSHFVREYLNGKYGPASTVSPYTASMFFALDRYEASSQIRDALETGKIVLSNRYVGSNMAHQGSKFGTLAERRTFFLWADNLEYEVLGIPRPHISIFLRVPAEISYELIAQKAARSYTKASHDEHEGDMNHLRESVAAYDLMCQLFTKDFKAIDCVEDGKIRSVAEINNLIWEELQPLLPPPNRKGQAVTLKLNKSDTPTTPSASPDSKEISVYALINLIAANPETRINWKTVEGQYKPSLPQAIESIYNQRLKDINKLSNSLVRRLKKTAALEVGSALTPLSGLIELEAINNDWRWPPLKEIKPLIPKNASVYRPELLSELSVNYGSTDDEEPAKLLWAGYRNEFDILATHAFEQHAGSYESLKSQISDWPYQKKSSSLTRLLNKDSLLRSKIPYRFEVNATIGEVLQLYSQGLITGLRFQDPTPQLGYPIPDSMETANQAENYSEAFDISFELFSQLEAVKPDIAPYGLLLGHRIRWHISMTLDDLWRGRNNALFEVLADQLQSTNPLVAELLASTKPA